MRKCEDPDCCIPPNLPREKLTWLPDPELDLDGEHFRPYADVNGIETTEKDRPSLHAPQTKGIKRKAQATGGPDTQSQKTFPEPNDSAEQPVNQPGSPAEVTPDPSSQEHRVPTAQQDVPAKQSCIPATQPDANRVDFNQDNEHSG